MNVLFLGQRDFFTKASRTGLVLHQGTIEIAIDEILWSIRESYKTIWNFPFTDGKWHSEAWPCTTIQTILPCGPLRSHVNDIDIDKQWYIISQIYSYVHMSYIYKVWHPQSIRFLTEPWPHYQTWPFIELWDIGLSTHFHSTGYLVPSHLGLAYALLVETNTLPKFVVIFWTVHLGTFSILLSFISITSVFKDFLCLNWTTIFVQTKTFVNDLNLHVQFLCPCYIFITYTLCDLGSNLLLN